MVFTIAHEVGHWVLHRQYIEAQENDGSRQIIVSKKGNSKETIEWQADYFASCLLMPENEVREAFEKVCAPEPLIVKNSMNTDFRVVSRLIKNADNLRTLPEKLQCFQPYKHLKENRFSQCCYI